MGRIYTLAQPQMSSFPAAQKALPRPVERDVSLAHLSDEEVLLLQQQQQELGFATLDETIEYLSTLQINRIKRAMLAEVPPRVVKGKA